MLESLVWVSRTIQTKHWEVYSNYFLPDQLWSAEDDAVEEAEEGELEEEGGDSEEIDLVLELSADLD